MTTTLTDFGREHETARVRADFLRRAEAQGIKPCTSLQDLRAIPK